MSCHGLSGPERTDFVRSVVANREDKIHDRRIRACELIPGLAAQSGCREAGKFKLLQRLRPDCSRGMTACTIRSENASGLMVQNGLCQNGASRVAGAQKQNIVVSGHFDQPFPISEPAEQQPGLQQLASAEIAGLVPRIKALMNLPSVCAAIASTSTPEPVRNCLASSML